MTSFPIYGGVDDLASIRHVLYHEVFETLERWAKSAEGEAEQEFQQAMRALDALYVLSGRMTVGAVDGDPD